MKRFIKYLCIAIVVLICHNGVYAQAWSVGLRSGIGLWRVPEPNADPFDYAVRTSRVPVWEKDVFGRMELKRFAFELGLAHRSLNYESVTPPYYPIFYTTYTSKRENDFLFSLGTQYRLPFPHLKNFRQYAGLRVHFHWIYQEGTKRAYASNGDQIFDLPVDYRRHDFGLGVEYLACYDLTPRANLQCLIAYRTNWERYSLFLNGFIAQFGIGCRLHCKLKALS